MCPVFTKKPVPLLLVFGQKIRKMFSITTLFVEDDASKSHCVEMGIFCESIMFQL
jgi:hypothetical protein